MSVNAREDLDTQLCWRARQIEGSFQLIKEERVETKSAAENNSFVGRE